MRGNQDPGPKAELLFLDCSSLVFASPPFPDQQLFEPALWNSEKVTQKGFCAQEFHRVLLDLSTLFSLILLNPEENRCWTRRGIIILNRHVNHKLSRGTLFYEDSVSNSQTEEIIYRYYLIRV